MTYFNGCVFVAIFYLQSLTLVRFNSSSLANLSLVGCRTVTILELSCPSLQRVNLAGCDHLESASFCPVSNVDRFYFVVFSVILCVRGVY